MNEGATDVISPLVVGATLGLVLSWGIGLLPALIYRYAIFRRPIPKGEVFCRLALPVMIIMLLFKATMAVFTDSGFNANPLPWIIIYYMGKWIMTRTPRLKHQRNGMVEEIPTDKIILGVSCTRCGFQLPKPDWRCPECYFEFGTQLSCGTTVKQDNETQSEQEVVEKHDDLAKMLSAAAGFRAAELVNGKDFTNEQVRLYLQNYSGKYSRQTVEAGIGVILMKRVNGDAPKRERDPIEQVEITARQMAGDPAFSKMYKRLINNDFKR
jgi:hypothetical protein